MHQMSDAAIVESRPGDNSTEAGDLPFLLVYRVTSTHEDSGRARSWINVVPLDRDLKRNGDPIQLDLPKFDSRETGWVCGAHIMVARAAAQRSGTRALSTWIGEAGSP